MTTAATATRHHHLIAATIPALVITLLLFMLMQQLIKSETLPLRSPTVFIDQVIVEPRKDSAMNTIIRALPEPEQPKARPESVSPDFTDEPGFTAQIPITPVLPGLELGGPAEPMTADKAATAIVRIDPRYPVEAAKNGIEGWVKLSFSIDETGTVVEVKVIDSEPKRIFDREAVKALKSWKYQPQWANGKAIMQRNLQVQLDFSLDKAAY